MLKFVILVMLRCMLAAASKEITCQYTPGAQIDDNSTRTICCNHAEKIFRNKWFGGGNYLTTYLGVLKSWKCKQFKDECNKPTYNFTEFTSLVYQRECSQEQLFGTCQSKIEKVTNITAHKTWMEFASQIDVTELDNYEILEPCVQIATYDSKESGFGRYHEVVQPYIPFCGFVWCGFDVNTLKTRRISSWTCMPAKCKANIVVTMTILGIFALVTLIGNLTIITVFTKYRNLRNSQAFYKATLAIGDIIVGGVVIPTFIYTFYVLLMKAETMGDELVMKNDSTTFYNPAENSSEKFSKFYIRCVGFCTSFSLFVSVYSLTAASFDRLSAITNPLEYNRGNAQYWSAVFCIGILTIGVVFAAIPLFTNSVEYDVVAFVLVAMAGDQASITYSITFLIPLLTVWITTVVILAYSRKHARIRRSMSNKKDTFEKRLAITLAIMVIVFSGVVLPGIIVMVFSLQSNGVFLARPKELNPKSASVYRSFGFISVILLTSNSLWNIFIYSSMQIEFRKAVKQLYLDIFKAASRPFTRRSSLKRKPRSRRIVGRNKAIASSSKTDSSYLSQTGGTLPCSSTRVTREEPITGLRSHGGTMESILEAVENNE